MEKNTLLANLDKVLKDIHYSNMPFKRLAIRAIEAVCAEPNKEEYKVFAEEKDTDFFFRYEPWEAGAVFKNIFKHIGMKVEGVTEGAGDGGASIGFKLVK
jgi:hypothetical protein